MCRLITIVVSFALLALTRCDAQGNIFKRDTNNVNIISVGFNQWPQKTQWKYISSFLKGTMYLYSINFLKGKKNKNIFLKFSLNGNYGNINHTYFVSKKYTLFPQIGIRYQKKIWKKIPCAFYTDILIGYHYGYATSKNKTYLNQINYRYIFYGGGLNLGLNYFYKNIFIGCDFGLSATITHEKREYIYINDRFTYSSKYFSLWTNSIFGLKIGFKI